MAPTTRRSTPAIQLTAQAPACHVHVAVEVLGVEAVAVGWQILQGVTVEIDGSSKAACVADGVGMLAI